MGNFYTNITVRVASSDLILPLLKGRNAFVTPAVHGYVTVYDEKCDDGGLYPNEFASLLSKYLGTMAIVATVHDDDILYFDVFQSGQRLDEYDSWPNYFIAGDKHDLPPEGGNPALLAKLFGCSDLAHLKEVLYTHDKSSEISIFATARHGALAKLLRLPEFSVGYGYRHLSHGAVPDGLTASQLRQVRSKIYYPLPRFNLAPSRRKLG